MPLKNSCKKSEGAKSRCGCKKSSGPSSAKAQGDPSSNADPEEGSDGVSKAPAQVVWDRYPTCTERLLDFLNAHANVTLKLFGDSMKAAKSEGCLKVMAKSNKVVVYLQLVEGIFSIDSDLNIQSDFAFNLNKYVKAVDNYIANT